MTVTSVVYKHVLELTETCLHYQLFRRFPLYVRPWGWRYSSEWMNHVTECKIYKKHVLLSNIIFKILFIKSDQLNYLTMGTVSFSCSVLLYTSQ